MINSRFGPEEALCDNWRRRSLQIDGIETLIQFIDDTLRNLGVLAYSLGILPAARIASVIALRSSLGQERSCDG